jgi:hypothetical protein
MPRLEGINKVLIIGSGAIKIGEAGERPVTRKGTS